MGFGVFDIILFKSFVRITRKVGHSRRTSSFHNQNLEVPIPELFSDAILLRPLL